MAAPPVPARPLTFGAQGEFLTRRSYCSTPGLVELTAVVVVLRASGPPTVRVVGTGVVAVVRRFERQRPDPRAVTAVGFQGLTGVLARVTRLLVHNSCEFAFATRCFPTLAMTT